MNTTVLQELLFSLLSIEISRVRQNKKALFSEKAIKIVSPERQKTYENMDVINTSIDNVASFLISQDSYSDYFESMRTILLNSDEPNLQRLAAKFYSLDGTSVALNPMIELLEDKGICN